MVSESPAQMILFSLTVIFNWYFVSLTGIPLIYRGKEREENRGREVERQRLSVRNPYGFSTPDSICRHH